MVMLMVVVMVIGRRVVEMSHTCGDDDDDDRDGDGGVDECQGRWAAFDRNSSNCARGGDTGAHVNIDAASDTAIDLYIDTCTSTSG
jgi:hypothetical protein